MECWNYINTSYTLYSASVTVAVVGKHEGRVFEERELSFLQGEGAEQGVTEGVDIAVKGMKKDEVAR